MRILLTGASGFIGRNLKPVLESIGHEVVPVSRRYGVDFTRMLSAPNWLPWLDDVDAVINAVGIIGETRGQRFDVLHSIAPKALFDACEQAGVPRVVQISALGTDDAAFSAYHLSKRDADDHLRSLDLDWFILRPAIIYGRGGTSAKLFMRLARLPVLPVPGDGSQRLQPVHIADLVATIMLCLHAPAKRTLDVVGNETVDLVEWLQRMRGAQGLPPAPVLRLPVRAVMAAVHFGQWIHPMIRVENIRMLMTGTYGEGSAWREFLGRSALDFTPELLYADAAEALASGRNAS